MTISPHIEELVGSLPERLNDVSGAMVATLDGRVLANASIAAKPHQIAAMTSSSLALSTRIVETINGGQLSEVAIAGSEGNVLVYAIGQKAVLMMITTKNPNLALINWETRKVIAEMLPLLG